MLEGSLKLPLAGQVFITRVEERAQLECEFMLSLGWYHQELLLRIQSFWKMTKNLQRRGWFLQNKIL